MSPGFASDATAAVTLAPPAPRPAPPLGPVCGTALGIPLEGKGAFWGTRARAPPAASRSCRSLSNLAA